MRKSPLFIFSFLLFVCCVMLGYFILHNGTFVVDTRVESFVLSIRSDALTNIMFFATALGGPYVLSFITIIVSVVFIVRRHITYAAIFVSSLALGVMSNLILKSFLKINRPPDGVVDVFGWSYPSGHTTMATIIFLLIALFVAHKIGGIYKDDMVWHRRWFGIFAGIIAFILIILVASSRVYLSAHFLSDVVGGICLGLSVVFLAVAVLRNLQKTK